MSNIMALIRPDGVTVDRIVRNIDPNAKTKPGFKWLPYTEIKPGYDGATQVREGPVRTITATEVTDTWTVRTKNASELDAVKDGEIASVDRVMFIVAFNMENRVRTLEGRPQITQAQYRTALKALI